MKKPDKIKKGLECCDFEHWQGRKCEQCPYMNADDEWCDSMDEIRGDAIAYIQQLEAQVPRWISVKDRLPEIYETVIIWRSDCHKATIGWNFQPGWSVPKGVEVTHWMPLPEPPKEE